MALQHPHTDNTDTSWTAAYHRVVIVNLDYAAKEAYIRVNIYKDKAARTAGKQEVGIRQYYVRNETTEDGTVSNAFNNTFDPVRLSPADMNPTKQAYTYVSTQPEYKNATTV